MWGKSQWPVDWAEQMYSYKSEDAKVMLMKECDGQSPWPYITDIAVWWLASLYCDWYD